MRAIAIPTHLEQQKLGAALTARDRSDLAQDLVVVGFGPVGSAVGATRLAHASREPLERMVHVGIGGTFDPERFAIGECREFGRVQLDGVGVGSSDAHLDADALGFAHLDGVGGRIDLDSSVGAIALTVCAASANNIEAAARRKRFENALCEDMESYSVALACRTASSEGPIPLTILRAASNLVGDRDLSHWKIDAAIEAIALALDERLPRP